MVAGTANHSVMDMRRQAIVGMLDGLMQRRAGWIDAHLDVGQVRDVVQQLVPDFGAYLVRLHDGERRVPRDDQFGR